MPPARHDGDGPEHRRDRAAARPASEHHPARARAQSVRRRLPAGQRRATRVGAQAARLEDRALHPPARPRRGPPCHGMVAGADRGAHGARWIGARDQRGVHLPPYLQSGRSSRGPAPAARAAQAEAWPAASQRRREPAIPNRTPIHQLPTKAHLRSQFGHCEGDLMLFRRQRDILLTLQERRSRLTLARRLQAKMPTSPPRPSPRAGRAARHGPSHHHPRQRRRVRAA